MYFFDLPEWALILDLHLATDASGNLGFDVSNNSEWFHKAWLPSLLPLGMAYKELYILSC